MSKKKRDTSRQKTEGQAACLATAAPAIEGDPTYEEALAHLQQGRWPEAGEALAALKCRYPESDALQGLQQALQLHLSAEETWSEGAERQAARLRAVSLIASLLEVPTVRALLLANLLLYLALGALRLYGA